MSPVSFNRFIKRRTGKTFIEYVNDTRIGYAARWLIEKELSIAEIAFKCGFNNIANFNRVFKKNKEPEKAIKAYSLSFAVYDLLSKEYFLQDTKLLSQGQNRLRTEKYLEVLYGQYTSSSDQSYLNLVFEIIEKTKSPLVRQALHLQNLSQTIQKDTLIFTYNH